MAKRPNALGRIEADPKPKKDWNKIGKVAGIVATVVVLIASGIAGTLGYQSYVAGIKAQGVEEYKTHECQKYSNEDKSMYWLECDAFRVENNV